MTEPSGKIVARPLVARACGHEQEFQHYEVDKYRPQRLAKFQATRCAGCAAKLAEERRRVAVPKAEALKRLPPGAQVALALGRDGSWSGTLTAGGVRVEAAGAADEGPQSLVGTLAQLWLAETAGHQSPA